MLALAAPVEKLDLDLRRALDLAENSGHAQAAFRIRFASLTKRDLRIDELDDSIAYIDDNHAQSLTHLRRSDADAVRLVHRFRHVIEQFPEPCIDTFHGSADFLQDRRSRLLYFQQRHASFPPKAMILRTPTLAPHDRPSP